MPVKNILVVDDSPTERFFSVDLLTKAGYQVSTAENGEEGIAKAKATMEADANMEKQLATKLSSVSGVNTDEEGVKIMAYTKAYQANAKVISTSESLQDLAGELPGDPRLSLNVRSKLNQDWIVIRQVGQSEVRCHQVELFRLDLRAERLPFQP